MRTTITTIITIILIFLLFSIFNPCHSSYRTRSGRMYRARNAKTAEIIDILRNICVHLSFSINQNDRNKLRKRLQNTSFSELIGTDPNILGWNYDKGREIGLKIYYENGTMYPEENILSTLFHELAHSLTDKWGHHQNWQEKDTYLQSFVSTYVPVLRIKISELN